MGRSGVPRSQCSSYRGNHIPPHVSPRLCSEGRKTRRNMPPVCRDYVASSLARLTEVRPRRPRYFNTSGCCCSFILNTRRSAARFVRYRRTVAPRYGVSIKSFACLPSTNRNNSTVSAEGRRSRVEDTSCRSFDSVPKKRRVR